MNAMTLYYDPEVHVWYKTNLLFHLMNFHENLRNLREIKSNPILQRLGHLF